MELRIELAVDGLPPRHRTHESAVEDFAACVAATPGASLGSRDQEPAAGPEVGVKGALSQWVLAVDGPSAAAMAAAAAAIFRSWLSRDRRRSVQVQIRPRDADPIEITASGENLSLEALQSAIESAVEAHNQRGETN